MPKEIQKHVSLSEYFAGQGHTAVLLQAPQPVQPVQPASYSQACKKRLYITRESYHIKNILIIINNSDLIHSILRVLCFVLKSNRQGRGICAKRRQIINTYK